MSSILILTIPALIEIQKASLNFNLESILSFWVFKPEDLTLECRVIFENRYY